MSLNTWLQSGQTQDRFLHSPARSHLGNLRDRRAYLTRPRLLQQLLRRMKSYGRGRDSPAPSLAPCLLDAEVSSHSLWVAKRAGIKIGIRSPTPSQLTPFPL
jgi:hypothetical protein